MKYIIIFLLIITLASCDGPEEIKSGIDINTVSVTETADTEPITSEMTTMDIGNIHLEEMSKRFTLRDDDKQLSETQISEIEAFLNDELKAAYSIIRTFYMNPTGNHDQTMGDIYVDYNGRKYYYDELINYNDLAPDEYKSNGRVYGNYEYMQKVLPKMFTGSMINEFFSYKMPCGYIVQDNKVYACAFTGSAIGWQKFSDLTVADVTDQSVTLAFDYLPMDKLDENYNLTQTEYELGTLTVERTGDGWRIASYKDLSIDYTPGNGLHGCQNIG